MPRKATGTIVETTTGGGITYGARFRAGGKRRYQVLGRSAEGFTRGAAEAELAYLLAQVERGDWTPPAPPPAVVESSPAPTFHVFASEWFAEREDEWAPNTRSLYRILLVEHLLPYFQRHPIDGIRVADVDAYRAHKLAAYREGLARLDAWHARREQDPEDTTPRPAKPCGPPQLNKSIRLLGAILDAAVERELLDRNPCRVNPRNRRAKVRKRTRAYLDTAEQIGSLLDAAGRLDARSREDRRHVHRRAFIAVLVFGGLRLEEATHLRWRHVDLAGGRLTIPGTKTDAAERRAALMPPLRSELARIRPLDADPDALVFPTATGRAMRKEHARGRIVYGAVREADAARRAAGLVPLPEGLTPHGLRHTWASMRLALGHDLATVAREGGWADLNTLLRVYTHAMGLEDDDREALRALAEGRPLPALNGQVWASGPVPVSEAAEAT